MNSCIFDWQENSSKILDTLEYTTKNHQYMEQVALFRFLMDRSYSKDEIFDLWRNTNSDILLRINGDMEEMNYMFGKLWSQASKWHNCTTYEIILYKEEIDYINNLIVLPWIKQYLLALLCIYKYYGRTWCKYTKAIKTFCFSVTSHKRERDEHRAQLSDCLRTYRPYDLAMSGTNLSYKINFLVDNGNEVVRIPNPRYIEKALAMLTNIKICVNCGEKFEYNFRTLANLLCPACAKKKRHRLQYECHQRQKDNKQPPNSIL